MSDVYHRVYGRARSGDPYLKSWSGVYSLAHGIRLCEESDYEPLAYEVWVEPTCIEHPSGQAAYAQRVAVLIREGKGLSGGAVDVKVVINEHKPRKPVPACPPEVWAAPAAGVDYMAAVRAMCKGDAK